MIPIIIFIAVSIIGILVYLLVKKKKSENKNLKKYTNKKNITVIKCNENQVLINNKCKRVLDQTDCKPDEFMLVDNRFENTSCREMTTNEKIKYCKDSGLVFYDNMCASVKSEEDCENVDQFSIPDELYKNTKCRQMTKSEKKKYCIKNNSTFFEDKCVKQKTDDMCPKNRYQKPDPKTNFTTCTKMSDDEIKKLCKSINKIFNEGQCIDGVSPEYCKSKYEPDEPLFYKVPNEKKTKCVSLSGDEKMKICSSLGREFDGKKCSCPKDTVLINGQCLGGKTLEQCNLENLFSKPNEATGNTTCIPMNQPEKEKYCLDKNMIYFKKNCKKVLTKEDCKKETSQDPLFKKVPDELTKNTSCRNLTLSEKETACEEMNRFWDGNDCLIKLGKPTIKLIKSYKYSYTFEIKVVGDINLNEIIVKHEMDEDPCECKDEWFYEEKKYFGCDKRAPDNKGVPWCYVKGGSKCGSSIKSDEDNSKTYLNCNIESFSQNNKKNIGTVEISKFDSENKTIQIILYGIKQNTTYKMKIKLLTNNFGLESPFSDIIEFKTDCDSEIYTRSYCRNNNGPENTTNTLVKDSRKDKDVNKWPFFKVPNIVNGKACGCRKLKESEAKQLCINTFYPTFKGTNRDVIIKGNKCLPAPTVVGPVSNVSIKNLNINQEIDFKGNVTEITNPDNYIIDTPYRILITFYHPKFINLEINEETIPKKFKLYRKNLETGEEYNLITEQDYFSNYKIDEYNSKEEMILDYLQNKLFFYISGVEPSTLYEFKIVPVNSIGEGPYYEVTIKTKEKTKTKAECQEILEDKNEDISFDGFPKMLDELNNVCVSMSTIQRNNVCRNLDAIEEGYENIYDPISKKCVPLTMNLELPENPSLTILEKTFDSVKLKIIPPNNFGIPSLTDYIVTWENTQTNETGRLTHGINYSNKNIAGSESYSNAVYVKPHPNGLDVGIELIHNNLDSATMYEYSIEAVSFNDNLWENYTGSLSTSMEDNRVVGKSELFNISVETNFSVPLKSPKINVFNVNNRFVLLNIGKVSDEYTGGSVDNKAEIKKYKIKRITLPKGENLATYFKSELEGKEIIFDLDNLQKFNEDNFGKIMVSKIDSGHSIMEIPIEPSTNYRYYIFSMNNKINEWSEKYEYVDVVTPELPPYYECKNPTNLNIIQEFSSTNVNAIDIRISWDESINPNIARFERYNIFKQTKGYPKYDIIIYSDNDRKEFQDLENNFLTIKNLYVDTDYKLKLIVRHRGILEFSNGFKYLIETKNETNSEDAFHNDFENELNVKKPLRKSIKTLGFNSDDDCKKNNLYFDRKSFSENIKVPFYLDNSNPRKCVSRHNNYKKLTEFCKEIKDVESVYWSSTKECKIPKNGRWIKEPVFDSSCTRNGIDGDKIVCGGGSQIEKKYVYEKPETDLAVKLFDPNKNGKDVDPPAETTEYLINGKRVAYKFKSCSNNKCKDLCKSKYGQIQDSAYLDKSKDIELPLSLPDLNDNTYCKKDVKQSVSINLPSEVCPSCGNYNKEKINRNWTCLDGFAGDSKITKCAEQGPIKNEVVNFKDSGKVDKKMLLSNCKSLSEINDQIKEALYLPKNYNSECKSGYSKIMSKELCEKAANHFNLTNIDWEGGSNNPQNLTGCFIESGVVRFNNSNGVSKHVNMKPICIKNKFKDINIFKWSGEIPKIIENDNKLPKNNISKEECNLYSKILDIDIVEQNYPVNPMGCFYRRDPNTDKFKLYFNRSFSTTKCGHHGNICLEKINGKTNNYEQITFGGSVGGKYDGRVGGGWGSVTVKGWSRSKYGSSFDDAKKFCDEHDECVGVAQSSLWWNWPVHKYSTFKPCNTGDTCNPKITFYKRMLKDIKCGSNNFCLRTEDKYNEVFCYGSKTGCLWGQNDCRKDSDCLKYTANSPKFPSNNFCNRTSGWPDDACENILVENNPTVKGYPPGAAHNNYDENGNLGTIQNGLTQEQCLAIAKKKGWSMAGHRNNNHGSGYYRNTCFLTTPQSKVEDYVNSGGNLSDNAHTTTIILPGSTPEEETRLSEKECEEYAKSLGKTMGKGNDTSGCYLAPNNSGYGVYYNKETGKGKCYFNSNSDYRKCVQKKPKLVRNGTPDLSMSEKECSEYARSVGKTFWVATGEHQDNNPSGCQQWSDGNIKFNKKKNNLPCTSSNKTWQIGCIQKNKVKSNAKCIGSFEKNEPYYFNNLTDPGCCDGNDPFTHNGVKYCRKLENNLFKQIPNGCVNINFNDRVNNKQYQSLMYNNIDNNDSCNNENNCVSKNYEDTNIKDNIIEKITKEKDRIDGKWYKCHGLIDTNGNTVPREEYKNVSFCNPPYVLQTSEQKDESGKNILIKRDKYFMQKTKNCTEIPYCEYQKTKDRFPTFTNYCGEQTVSTNKVCLGPDGNSTTFDKCGDYTNSGEYKLTKVNKLESCQGLCEGPKNSKSMSNDGYDKWRSFSDKLEAKTKEEYQRLCKAKTFIKPKYYTVALPGSSCGGCGAIGKKKEVYDVCEDGLYGPESKTKCETFSETKNKYNSKIWNTIINENVDCDENGKHCSIRRKHISRPYSKNCPNNLPNCDWRKEGEETECSAFCNGGDKFQTVKCYNKENNETLKIDCGTRPSNMWESKKCNTEKCSQICTSKGNKWTGSENKPYTEDQFNAHCEEVEAVPRVLHLDTRSCEQDMKGCGYTNLKKVSFCIDGIGQGTNTCQEYIDSDTSGRAWVKKSNKTNKYYDPNKDCKTGNDDYVDNYEECHDISDDLTWDIVSSKRNQYYATENIDCSQTGYLGFIDGNKAYCDWTIAGEIDTLDCQGTVFRTYKCTDEQGNNVNLNRCNPAAKPPERVNRDLTCQLKSSKWVNNAGERNSADAACNVCGTKQSQIITRQNKCIRSDYKEINRSHCIGDLPSVKTCNKTDNCICTCNNGTPLNQFECDKKLGFTNIEQKSTNNMCESCDYGYRIEDAPQGTFKYFDQSWKPSTNLMSKCTLKLLESHGSPKKGIEKKRYGSTKLNLCGYYHQGRWHRTSQTDISSEVKQKYVPKYRCGNDGIYSNEWRNELLEKYKDDDTIKGIVFSTEVVGSKNTYDTYPAMCIWDIRNNKKTVNILKSHESAYRRARAWGVTNDCFDATEEERGDNQKGFMQGKCNYYSIARAKTFTHYYPKVEGKHDSRGKNCKKNTCLCENGTPTTLCGTNNENRCQSCNEGYYLLNNTCYPNKNASCVGGTPSDGNELIPFNNFTSCKSCNTGYRMGGKYTYNVNQNDLKKMNVKSNYNPLIGRSSNSGNKISTIDYYRCFPNQADCWISEHNNYRKLNNIEYKYSDGDSNIKYVGPWNNLKMCKSCPPGYSKHTRKEAGWLFTKAQADSNNYDWNQLNWMNENESWCFEDRTCICPNGVPAKRSVDGISYESGCPLNAKYGCKSCDEGYSKISYQQAKNTDTQANSGIRTGWWMKQGSICVPKNEVTVMAMTGNNPKKCKQWGYTAIPEDECTQDFILSIDKDSRQYFPPTISETKYWENGENATTSKVASSGSILGGCSLRYRQNPVHKIYYTTNGKYQEMCSGDTGSDDLHRLDWRRRNLWYSNEGMIPHKLNWNSGDQIKKLGSKAPSVNRTWTWSYPKEHESCCKDIIWWMKEIPGTSCSTNSTHTVKSTSKNVEVPSVGICKRWTPPSTSNLKIDLANNTKLKLS